MADRERVLSWMVQRSKDPCMIMFTDDEERARMSCGHAIIPGSLYDFCKNEIKAKKVEFRCPHVDENNRLCNVIWNLQEVRLKACLNDEENYYMEQQLNENAIFNEQVIRPCPICMAWSERQSPRNNCVRCIYCLKEGQQSDFCWNCLRTWAGKGTTHCGNPRCSLEDDILEILRTCPTKQINSLWSSEIDCPSKRACPSCGFLVEHTDGCSIIECRNCHIAFCFICLQNAGYVHIFCNLATRQTKPVNAGGQHFCILI